MKKYFIAGSDEELEFGDVIALDLTKETKHGTHCVESEVTFSPDILPLLLEIGAVEEKDEKNLVDFSEDEPSDELDELYERVEDIEASMEAQGEMIDEMMEGLKSLVDILNKAVQEETEKKPKHNKKK
jgi:hypothetical protein